MSTVRGEMLANVLERAIDCLGEARSGSIAGSSSDLAWDAQRDSICKDAEAALRASTAPSDPCPYCKHEMQGAADCEKCGCGSPTRATRASAAPEEGKAAPGAESIKKILKAHFWTGEPGEYEAIEAATLALSPDSRKAAPVAWRSRSSGEDWHYHDEQLSQNDFARQDADFEEQSLYAALTPATEDGGREYACKYCADRRIVGRMYSPDWKLVDEPCPKCALTQAVPPTWLGDEGSGP